MLNIALTGVSGYADTHYQELMRRCRSGEINIIGVAVINQKEEEEKCRTLKSCGCEVFNGFNEMLDKLKGKIDLCFIPTGIALHAPMAIAAMKAGANVCIEKPAAATVQEINDMRKAEKECGKFTAVGFQSFYLPEIIKIRSLIASGRLGKLTSVCGIGISPRAKSYYTRNNWVGKIRNNGMWVLDSPANNAFAHYLHLSCLFANSAMESVEAQLFKVNGGIECADNACIHATTASGCDVLFYSTHTPDAETSMLKVIAEGSLGSIEWTPAKTVYKFGTETVTETNPPPGTATTLQADALLDKIRGKQVEICGLDNAFPHTLLINGAHDSTAIINVPAEFTSETGEGDNLRKTLKGINEEILSACAEKRMLSRKQFPWLAETEKISLKNYASFSGKKLL